MVVKDNDVQPEYMDAMVYRDTRHVLRDCARDSPDSVHHQMSAISTSLNPAEYRGSASIHNNSIHLNIWNHTMFT